LLLSVSCFLRIYKNAPKKYYGFHMSLLHENFSAEMLVASLVNSGTAFLAQKKQKSFLHSDMSFRPYCRTEGKSFLEHLMYYTRYS